MIVPGDKRRRRGVNALQIGIEPVLGVAVAVGRQRGGFDAVAVGADAALLGCLVDIVAEEQHHIGIFVGEMPIGGKVAELVM